MQGYFGSDRKSQSGLETFRGEQTHIDFFRLAGVAPTQTGRAFSNVWDSLNDIGLILGGISSAQSLENLRGILEFCEALDIMALKYKTLENWFKAGAATIEGVTFGSYNKVEDCV